MTDDRKATVREALRAEDVANHLGIKLQWRGRWARGRRCARSDHGSDAFGLARDGMWHCHACDEGGDLFKLIAVGEGLDVRADFGKVLEIAAGIAGVDAEDDFGGSDKPAPKARPAPPPVEPLEKRLELARRRAAWVWGRMMDQASAAQMGRRLVSLAYLESARGIDPVIGQREDVRDAGVRCYPEELKKGGEELARLVKIFSVPGVAVPVRNPNDGGLVDIRIRRFDPRPDQPKIVGMLGGVTSAPAADGKGRELLGCYGFPHELTKDTIVVVEGLIDYLTAVLAWPEADVLGAVESGSLSLVAKHAALALAQRGDDGRLLIVEHADGFGKAGDKATNEEPNAAAKVAIRILGPRRVGWVFCDGVSSSGEALKDLNDLWRTATPIDVRWWSDLGEAA